jgi:hypothetical protein
MCTGQEQGLDVKILFLSVILSGSFFSAAFADNAVGLDSLNRFDYSKVDEMVLDKATQLTWRTCSVGQQRVKGEGCQGEVIAMSWQAAEKIKNSEWRLPTHEELVTLIDKNKNENKVSPRLNRTLFPSVDKTKLNYWTSDAANENEAWYVNFGLGPIAGKADKNSQFAVRLVKGTFVPPAPEVKPPQDIYEFLGRRDDCNHFAGEFSGEPADRARDKQIDRTMTEMRCNSVEADERKLRKKYQGKPDILKWLNERPE